MSSVDTLIFDIDDTLYSVSSGFSEHRNGPVVHEFMVKELGFGSAAEAKECRDDVFKKHHSTLKGLVMANAEGRLPRPFEEKQLGEYWSEHCDFERFLKPSEKLHSALCDLKQAGLKLVVFTNAPRLYALKCLEQMGVRQFFDDHHIFAVEDVMPACKPEPVAFEKVVSAVGSVPSRCVMFEDSMKNIRACHSLGIHTVLIDEAQGGPSGGEAALLEDVSNASDPAVGAVLERIEQIRERLSCLFEGRFVGV